MRCILTAVIATVIATSAPAAATVRDGAGLRTPASVADGLRVARLSTFAIRDLLEAHGYRDIGKITFNGFSYITRATDRNGRRVKLYVDPSTAKVLKKKFYK
jgi:hypothetical protein